MNYLEWNNAIAAKFFNRESAHRPVYLYVTREHIDAFGEHDGAGLREFVFCVLGGPPWIKDNRLSLCGKAHHTFRDWRSNLWSDELEYPPYVAYLALFVLAAGTEGDFAPHAYYPRLRDLVGDEDKVGMPYGFNKMWELWMDLEEWSKSDRNGELGEFEFRASGDWRHVGLPVAQTLLSESDRRGLPLLFAACGLDPASPPTEAELLALLTTNGVNILQRRTRRLLSSADTAARLALVYAVAAEVEHWHGCVSDNGEDAPPSVAAVLRLSCHLDDVAMTVRTGLRCKTNAEFPESDLLLAQTDGGLSLVAEEHGFGWSSELRHQGDDRLLDSTSLDWTIPFELQDEARKWRAVMPSATVRVFQSGASFGLPGYIEASRIAKDAEFIIAACQNKDEIRQWGESECEGFRELRFSTGLPEDWRLFRVTAVKSDSLIRNIATRLALPSSIRIQLRGGIASQEGTSSRFFSFARPTVLIDGPNDELTVDCDGKALSCVGGSSSEYELPSTLPVNQTVRIEASTLSGDRSRRSIQLVDAAFSNWNLHAASFGPTGERLPDGAQGARGSSLDVAQHPSFDYAAALVPISAATAFLIGPIPGQALKWPADRLPEWPPAWIVVKEKRNVRAVPCMVDLLAAQPVLGRTDDHASVRLWKRVVRAGGRRLALPTDPEFSALWNRYREVARHA